MKIAITGGIGVGKSYVCRILNSKGIIVYDCDDAAKRLMATDENLRQELLKVVGKDVYSGEILQKSILAKFLLASDANKKLVEDVVHPYVARDFEQSGVDWLESAILFEAGFDKRVKLDYVLCVTAPEEVRRRRIILRDHISSDKAQEWIECQMPQHEILRRSDFEIINDGKHDVEQQVEVLLHSLAAMETKNK